MYIMYIPAYYHPPGGIITCNTLPFQYAPYVLLFALFWVLLLSKQQIYFSLF